MITGMKPFCKHHVELILAIGINSANYYLRDFQVISLAFVLSTFEVAILMMNLFSLLYLNENHNCVIVRLYQGHSKGTCANRSVT